MRTDPPTGDELARMLATMRGEVMRTALQDASEPASGRAERPGRGRGRVVAIAVALVSLLVVGGAGAALAAGIIPNPFDTPTTPTPAVTVTVTATPSSTPTPTPTLTPTQALPPEPVVDPLDTGTWIIDYDQAGDLAVGDSIAPFATAAGFEPNPSPGDCPSGYYRGIGADDEQSLDVTVSLVQLDAKAPPVDDPLLTLARFSTRTVPEAPLPSSPTTPTGIRIGSTEDELLAAYPGISTTVARYDDFWGYSTYVSGPIDGRYLVFQVGTSDSGSRTVRLIETSPVGTTFDICD